MVISASRVSFDAYHMGVGLSDGRTIEVPLEWFTRLQHAREAQRNNYRVT